MLVFLLLFLAMGGLFGGYMLVSEPSGAKLGAPLLLLEGLPIKTFLIPGLVLLIVLGIAPAMAVWGLLSLPNFRIPFLSGKHHWAWKFTGGLGVFLIGWTVGELYLWGMNFLSALYLGFGLLIVVAVLMPEVRRYTQNGGTE